MTKRLFVMVPVMGAVLRGLFKERSRFVEHLVFSLHVHTFTFLVLLVGLPLVVLWPAWGALLPYLIAAAYLAVALRRHYELTLKRAIGSALLIGGAYLGMFLVLMVVVITAFTVGAGGS